ncbi:MAG: hypothetical protein ABF382_11880 [Akkermansiaceae bacterium]
MRFWTSAATAKSAWNDTVRASGGGPVTICLGGSATGFGIDAGYASRELNWPMVNLGLHAGMGPEVLTGFALSKAKKGDTFLVMLEPVLLADSEMKTALGVQFAFAIGDPSILAWRESNQGGFMTESHLLDLRPGASNVFGLIGKIAMNRPLYRYQVKDMRDGGLLTTSVSSGIVARKSSPEFLSESAKVLLQDLVSIANERGLKIIYGFPWVYSDEKSAGLVRRGRLALLNEIEKIMPVLHEDNLGVRTEKIDFRDSPQHLSEAAARRRTEELIGALEKNFGA